MTISSLLFIALRLASLANLTGIQNAGDLVQAANGDLQKKDLKALRMLGENNATMGWMDHAGRPGDMKWKVHLLKTPAGKQGDLVVFSAYHSCQSIGDHFHKLVKTASGEKIGPEIPEYETLGFRVRDHKFTVRYDVPGALVYFTDEAQVERTSASSGDLCLLRLSSNCAVKSVRCDAAGFSSTLVPGAIAIKSPEAKKFTVKLEYVGDFNDRDMDNYVHANECILNSYWYAHIGRLPSKSTVTVTAPVGWTAVGQGELLTKTELNGQTTSTFRNEIPVSYFSLDAGAYTLTSKVINGRPITVYKLNPNEEDATRALDECGKAMAVFEKSFGPFPYSRYGLVQTTGSFGGALEAYSFATFAGPRFGAVTHELAHTWFGGILSNPYTKTMWNESFADYADNYCGRVLRNEPGKALKKMHSSADFGRNYQRSFGVSINKATDTENPIDNAVGYFKGQLVLQLLEDTIGREMMLKSCQLFRSDHKDGEAADWPEFVAATAKATGKNLSWFFDQWLDRPGAPIVKLEGVKYSSGVLTGKIVQEGAPYRLKLTLKVETAAGPKSTDIDVDRAETPFMVKLASAPTLVTLDPDGNVLMTGGKVEREGSPFVWKF